MTLLLDQNLSDKLLHALDRDDPGSVHVRHVGLARADDCTTAQIAELLSRHRVGLESFADDPEAAFLVLT